MANHAQVLLFHVEPLKAARIESLCGELGIRASRVNPSEYSQKLGCLAGMPGFPREEKDWAGPDLPAEMMVFSNMEDILDRFLREYRQAGIPPVALKAVITSHNMFWTAGDLYEELFKEHQFYQKNSRG